MTKSEFERSFILHQRIQNEAKEMYLLLCAIIRTPETKENFRKTVKTHIKAAKVIRRIETGLKLEGRKS